MIIKYRRQYGSIEVLLNINYIEKYYSFNNVVIINTY